MSEVIAFHNPPVTEVVFSVGFALPRQLQTMHVGLYWNRIRDKFPVVEDQPPLDPSPQPGFGNGVGPVQLHFGLLTMPPLRRTWFIGADGRDLIQLQEDRFIFNWRRNLADAGYPGFDQVSQRFENQFQSFRDFLSDEGFPPPSYPVLELVYVNSITPENGLADVAFTSAMVDSKRDASRQRFLSTPLATNSMSLYPLHESAPGSVLQIQTNAMPHQVRVDITARGSPLEHSEEGRRSWFQLAHDAIVRGFVDVTDSRFHQLHWKREV